MNGKAACGHAHWITCWICPSCATSTSFSVKTAASLIRPYFLGWHQLHVGHVPVNALRVLLSRWNGWSWFPRMMTLFLASCMFGSSAIPLGWMTTMRTLLWGCGRSSRSLWWWQHGRVQPLALVKVPLHLLTRRSYSTETSPTHKIHVIMHADNVVQVSWIILDRICTKRATGYAWGLCPSLVSSGW